MLIVCLIVFIVCIVIAGLAFYDHECISLLCGVVAGVLMDLVIPLNTK